MAASSCRTFVPADPVRVAELSPALGQLLLAGFTGAEADDNAELEHLLCQTRVGCVVLFARNIIDAPQVARLTARLRERALACASRPPLVAVDAAAGQVMRLRPSTGMTPTLSVQEPGAAYTLHVTCACACA